MRTAYPAFSLLPCPLSPAPFPNGEGEIYGYFMQGAPPLASPAFNRLRHLQTFSNMNPAGGLPGWSPADLATAVPGGGLNSSGTCSPCPGGEDHLKRRRRVRRIVPSPPVPPLLGCRLCPWKGGSFGFAPNRRLPSALGTCLTGTINAASGSGQGCRGRSPRRNKLWDSPFPPGRGQGGWGRQSKLKAGQAGGKEGKPPPGKSALRARAGGWGRQSKLKAGLASGKESKPPRRGRQEQVEPSARRKIRKLSKQPQQQHLELHLLGNFTPQSFLRKILKTSCNLRRIVV